MADPTILVPRKVWTKPEVLKSYEAPGRKRGQLPGSYVAGVLAERKNAIWLCPDCNHKFDWKRHGYYPLWRFEKTTVSGNCDACRSFSPVCRFFVYEPTVPQVWLTKDKARYVRRFATVVGG